MSNNKIVAVLLTDCGMYEQAIAPAWHHVLIGTRNEEGIFTVKGSNLIANGCAATAVSDNDLGTFSPDFDYAFGAHMYAVMNEDVVYSNLKLLNDSVYLASDMSGKQVQGFHIDSVLDGPAGYAITGTELHVHQPKFEQDEALYLWEEDQVEVLPITTH